MWDTKETKRKIDREKERGRESERKKEIEWDSERKRVRKIYEDW